MKIIASICDFPVKELGKSSCVNVYVSFQDRLISEKLKKILLGHDQKSEIILPANVIVYDKQLFLKSKTQFSVIADCVIV